MRNKSLLSYLCITLFHIYQTNIDITVTSETMKLLLLVVENLYFDSLESFKDTELQVLNTMISIMYMYLFDNIYM